ncbi:sensor histidine kinase [Streptacidiphilus jiangxiensis]|uniref:histidine kinase n=1 Tax=Streptacidiphilus jiangxiensis TaxID=235985 RepID=A0A1H7V4T1_STRJI|nr:HAMP domain-containing sensor histidine kinase [Streptacidiphilus jiangxiensis]SEM04144.1 Signal transduction histidine kinase [Streptacidiphilus jiangxiensis]
MTRRIALSVLSLVLALLVLAVVPLGISITARENDSFREETAARARTVASAAEEHLSDHRSDADAREQLDAAAARGDCAQVYDAHGTLLYATPCPTGALPPGAPAEVLRTGKPQSAQRDDRLTLAVPIGDTVPPSGALVYSRSTDGLDEQLLAIWGWLSLCALGALGAGVLVAVRLARWVSRPLVDLDETAARLGEGRLDARATVTRGPPEVRRLATTFNTMASRTENLMHGHRAVIADVSHQLRTPLTALRLRLDLLAADADPETAQELGGAQDEIARLSRLVDGLLAVARAENSVPRQVAVRLDAVVADRIAAWEPVAEERGVRLATQGPAGLTALLTSGDLEQVLDNLFANALDAVPTGGRIVVRAVPDPKQGEVLLSVVDDGPGMDEAARERAFRRFDTGRASGTGLGLAIVHRLVTANGGRAALEPTPGGGLTVRLWLLAAPVASRSERRERRDRRDRPND